MTSINSIHGFLGANKNTFGKTNAPKSNSTDPIFNFSGKAPLNNVNNTKSELARDKELFYSNYLGLD